MMKEIEEDFSGIWIFVFLFLLKLQRIKEIEKYFFGIKIFNQQP